MLNESYPVVQKGETFNLVPNKLACYVEMGGCLQKCKGCHSEYLSIPLAKDLWTPISTLVAYAKHEQKLGADCIVIMGGTHNRGMDIKSLIVLIKALSEVLPVCVYSGLPGKALIHATLIDVKELSYLKGGNYVESKGGLDNPKTNQMFWKRQADKSWLDITKEFQKKERDDK